MLRITQINLKIPHDEDALIRKVCRILHVNPEDIRSFRILRRSVDARMKPELYHSYTVEVQVNGENRIIRKSKNKHKNITQTKSSEYILPRPGEAMLSHPPVIIGSGPAGLFCGWVLARCGYRPLILERGEEAVRRKAAVTEFWETGKLDPESNVQFGEGGAGTFSDGKLNTGVRDPSGRNRFVLSVFCGAGAPEEICFDAKPHLGTDRLIAIVETMRNQITEMGGSVRFRSKVTELETEGDHITGVRLSDGTRIPAEAVVLAIGHSARDTFQMLYQRGVSMLAKPIAVGVRVEHPQELINLRQYGQANPEHVGAADYKLTAQLPSGRGIYSFCMCPGGYVVNASSEEGYLAVNGMSYHARDGKNANSAIVVTASPEDYLRMTVRDPGKPALPEPLQGLAFVRMLERNAYLAGSGDIPVQRYGDFCQNITTAQALWKPCIKGQYRFADVRGIFPEEFAADLELGLRRFGDKIRGFSDPETLLAGVESRTSSPVRILRDEHFQSNLRGLYPCGEGAGYAGGITSAAIDGVKIAEAIVHLYQNFG